jgi:hypothetical protein
MNEIAFDLNLAMEDPNYPGIRAMAAFFELELYLERLSDVVQFAQDQEFVRFKAMLEKQRHKLGRQDLQDKLKEVEYVALNLVPRFFMGAFVISLSAAYESSIEDIADFVRSKEKARLKIDDLRESAPHKRIGLYLETVIGGSYALPSDLLVRLDELGEVRNCLAHANGNLANEKERRFRKLESLAKTGCGLAIRDKSLIVYHTFCRKYLGHVTEAVNELLTRINEKYAKTNSVRGLTAEQ